MYNPFKNNIQHAERDINGDWFYTTFSSSNVNTSFKNETEKLNKVLNSPAALKVIKLICDTFSLAKITQTDDQGNVLYNSLITNVLANPNKFQTQRQFLWDYMFWNVLGTAYLNPTSIILTERTQMYWLMPNRLQWTQDLINKLDKVVLSKASLNEIKGYQIKYTHNDNSSRYIQLSELIPFFDLTNGLGNWYKGASTIDALYKVINNSELALYAKGINLEFSQKFFVTGQHKEQDVYGTPMGETEKQSIEQSVRSNKHVHATKSMVDIKHFVDNINKLKLDESYRESYFTIGNIFGIPRDVLEAFNSSTYENQQQAKSGLIEYCLQPKGNDLISGLERLFRIDNLNISWSHLSFMQYFENQKTLKQTNQLKNLKIAKELGILTDSELKSFGKEILNYDG